VIRPALPALLVASIVLAACGGSTSAPIPTVNAASGNTEAAVAAKASEPRTSDPTGAPPAPPPAPTAFANLGMTGAPPAVPAASPDPTIAPVNTSPPPKKISARHVLVQWMGAEHAPSAVVRSREQALVVAQDVLKRARAKQDFARLAVEYSDEPNAGQRGGSLGRFGHGQMVPQFEEAAFKLQVGEVSGIVESPFGFHVIQRTE